MPSNDLDPDTVLVVGSVRRPKRIIIVELQQAWDPGKLSQWPRYAASKWLRYECPVQLLRSDAAKKYYEYGLGMSPEIVRNALQHLMVTKFSEPFGKLGLS
jgi:hypothetical protein